MDLDRPDSASYAPAASFPPASEPDLEAPASPPLAAAPPPSPLRRKRLPPTTLQQWSALLRSPSELWWVYVVKLLFSYAHFSTGILLTLWLSDTLGLSDAVAGVVYGVGGLSATVWGVVGGAFVDRAGVARALRLGCVLAVIARALLVTVPSIASAAIALTLVMPLADSLGIPVLTIAVKRCVPKENPAASLAFSLFYVAQNVAALVAGLAIDSFRHALAAGKFPIFAGRPFALYELVFASGGVATALSLLIVWAMLPRIEEGPRAVSRAGRRLGIREACWRVLGQESFQRFARLTMILLGVSMIYRHLDATLPKYMLRVFGPDAPYGRYYALEPFIVIFAVPLAGTFITLPVYSTLILGTLIAAFSPFWMCLANKVGFAFSSAPLYWIHHVQCVLTKSYRMCLCRLLSLVFL